MLTRELSVIFFPLARSLFFDSFRMILSVCSWKLKKTTVSCGDGCIAQVCLYILWDFNFWKKLRLQFNLSNSFELILPLSMYNVPFVNVHKALAILINLLGCIYVCSGSNPHRCRLLSWWLMGIAILIPLWRWRC